MGIPHIKCDFCDKLFKLQRGLNDHIRSAHQEKRFQCVICGQKIANQVAVASSVTIVLISLQFSFSVNVTEAYEKQTYGERCKEEKNKTSNAELCM